MKTRSRAAGLIWIVLSCCSVIPAHAQQGPKLVKGVLDLRTVDLRTHPVLDVRGECEFYPGVLLTPGQIDRLRAEERSYLQVPSDWASATIDGLPFTEEGVGTYRFRVLVPQYVVHDTADEYMLALSLQSVSSAFAVYSNGEFVNLVGTVGPNPSSFQPRIERSIHRVHADRETLSVVIQVANWFNPLRGGIDNPLSIGTSDAIDLESRKEDAGSWLFVGVFIILGLYHLVVYSIRRDELTLLLIGGLSLLYAGKVLFDSPYGIYYLSPTMSAGTLHRWQYFFTNAIPLIFAILRIVFPEDIPAAVARVVYVVFGAFTILNALAPMGLMFQIYDPMMYFGIVAALAAFWGIARAVIRKRPFAVMYMVSLALLVVFGILEMLSASGIVQTPHSSTLGVLIFVSIQATIVAFRQSRAFAESTRLGRELEELNATLEKKVEERTQQLSESEARFRLYYDLGLIGMAMASTARGWTRVNDRLCEILGYSREELLGMSWVDITHPDDRPVDIEHFEKIQRGVSEGFHREKRYIRKDGSVIDVLVGVRCQRAADGSIKEILVIVEDITAMKQEQRERQRLVEELQTSEERFRLYFELGLIGMAITAPDKRWVQVNDRLCQMLGYTREELVRKTWEEITHPDDLEKDHYWLNRMISGEIDGYSFDKRYIHKDGTPVHVDLSVKCKRDELGGVKHSVVIIQDITDRIREREERERLVAELQEALTNIKTLGGLIPICASCKKIRDDKGYWNRLEEYLMEHADVTFTHGVCPDCMKREFPDGYKRLYGDL